MIFRYAVLAGLCASFAAWGCSDEASDSLPPPFVDEGDAGTQLFFPSAIALGAGTDESLYVANGNFDQAFSRGTLVQLRLSAFEEARGKTLPTRAAATSVGLLDNYAARVAATPTAVYVTTRGAGLLSRAPLATTLACPGSPPDCSANAIDLQAAGLIDPAALISANVALPGKTAPQPVILVSHLSPQSTGRTSEAAPAVVAVIPEPTAAPQQGRPFGAISHSIPLGVFGTSTLVADPTTRELFAGGCFQRIRPDLVAACSVSGAARSPLRSVPLDAGPTATVRTTELSSLIGAADVQDIALSSDATRLYLVAQNPASLSVIDRPAAGTSGIATLRAVVPLAQQPGRLTVLRRPSGDLVAVTAFASDVLLIVDPATESIVAEVRVGDGPFDIATKPVGAVDRIFVSLFNECSIAAVDVPARASDAAVVSRIGSCP